MNPWSPRRYRRRYLAVLAAHVELLGATTPSAFAMRLFDVYVDVCLKHRSGGADPAGDGERRSLRGFLDDPRQKIYVVTGGPGAGKTTLLRHTALELTRRPSRGDPLPVILELRQHVGAILRGKDPTIASLAASLRWLESPNAEAWFEGWLRKGRCIVLLDGLDEVADPRERRRVVTWVRDQIARYPDNHYVLTSRPHGYVADRIASADQLEIRDFTTEQIGEFVRNWYRAALVRRTGEESSAVLREAGHRAGELIERLRRRPGLFPLAANPLLLTMITNVHLSGNVLPGSRAALYREICDMLLHRRQEAKDLPPGLRVEQKLAVCRTLAAHMMRRRIRDVSLSEADEVISPVLAAAGSSASTADFLAEAVQGGMLTGVTPGVHAFAHKTFQEYLTAAELKERQDIEELSGHVDDPWWQETILLWAAGSDASPVIESCLASGGTHALRLAHACRHEAGLISPELRGRLEHRLTPGNEPDPDGRRALTSVSVARALEDVVWFGTDTLFCARPVSGEVYDLYLADRGLRRRDGSRGQGDEPVRGLWTDDVLDFVAWVNALPDCSDTYRLPGPEELTEQVRETITGVVGAVVWADGERRPFRYPAGSRFQWYVPSRSAATESVREILERLLALATPTIAAVRGASPELAASVARREIAALVAAASDGADVPDELLCAVVLEIWETRYRRPREEWVGVEVVATDLIRDHLLTRDHLADGNIQLGEPAGRIRDVRRALEQPSDEFLPTAAARLVRHAEGLIGPVLEGRVSGEPGRLARARLVLAVVGGIVPHGRLNVYIRMVNHGLAIIEQRAAGTITPDELLL